ncbi:MAG TPA: aldehyde oxidase [Candidatus Cloacimonetes bacterium]|nr:aldehyde oxidase [Candidatus Cloacimonadota bacterium]HEX38360.1 aldehyde oxidase [Candidatus Cloacimonadota bacterium]
MKNISEIRIDAASKISGEEQYVRDLQIDDLLYAKTIRSTRAHAKIDSIHFDEDFNWESFTIITAKDVPNNYVAIIKNDMPYLAHETVNYIGEPIVLIAAEKKQMLREAEKHIAIIYEELKTSLTIDETLTKDDKKDIFAEISLVDGDFEKAAVDAEYIIEETYETGLQEHVYIEPQCVVAIPEDNTIHIKGSMQCPYYVQNAMNELFKGTETKVDVTQIMTGGAFGGKEDFPSLICGHVALLAQKAQKPVMLSFDREEDIRYTTKRHPSKIHMKAAVDNDGTIQGLNVDILLDSGAYTTLSPVVLARAVLTSFGCYRLQNVIVRGRAVKTNIPPCGAFRGFGGPQALFAIEMLIEKIAHSLSEPVWDIKKRNLLSMGDVLPTGQPIDYSFGLPQCIEKVLISSKYFEKLKEFSDYNKNSNGILKGVGISLAAHGAGFTGVGENTIQAIAEMEVLTEGKVVIKTANTEMGQGVDTAYKIIVSKRLNIPFEDIVIEEKNTSKVPNSGPTVASRSTMIVGKLLVDNCDKILEKLDLSAREHTPDEFKQKALSFVEKNGNIVVRTQYKHPDFISFDEKTYKGYGYPVYSWSANVAEIEIDLTSYQVEVKKFYTAHDVGKTINRQQSEGQIQGGVLQGIGYGIYEEMRIKDGEIENRGFRDYIIPTIKDIPKVHVDIVEDEYFNGPFGAKALGELPLVGAAPAVASAVSFAMKKPVKKIPLTPEVIASMIEEKDYEY